MHPHRRVVLTRTPEDNALLRHVLAGVDVELVERPCIRIAPVGMNEEVRERLKTGHFDGVVFPSRNAVEHLFQQVVTLAPPLVVAIGPGTAAAIEAHGWPVWARPTESRAELAAGEIDRALKNATAVLIVRGEIGSTIIGDTLKRRGLLVEEAIVYRTEELAPEPLGPGEWFVVFASPSAVRAFAEANPRAAITALAIGETTGAACRELGWATRVATEPTNDGLAELVRAAVS